MAYPYSAAASLLYILDAADVGSGVDRVGRGIINTTTIDHFKDGEEVARIVGQQPEEEFQKFCDEYVLK